MQLRHLFPLVPAFAALLYACDDHDEPAAVGDVLLEGVVTDEAYVALDGALGNGDPINDPTRTATLDTPVDGASLPKNTVPTFSWHFGSTMTNLDRNDHGFSFGAANSAETASFVDWTVPLKWLLSPVRSAHAHGDPFNGTGTFLVFSTDADPSLVRVFTSNTTYTPSADSWSKMTSAGKPITLKLVSAIFESNRIAQDGGPFLGTTTTFTIQP